MSCHALCPSGADCAGGSHCRKSALCDDKCKGTHGIAETASASFVVLVERGDVIIDVLHMVMH